MTDRRGARGFLMPVFLHSLSTALPPHCLNQTDVAARAGMIFGERYPQFERLSRTFQTSGINQRYSVMPIDWFS
jgi:alkylresorcinol/alkylpyrone synthase